MAKTVHVFIQGRVQGVAYRYWTQDEAEKRSLCGWVRNCRDGSVEAVFSGKDEDVANMLDACWHGPMLAKVKQIRTQDYEDCIPEIFEILATSR